MSAYDKQLLADLLAEHETAINDLKKRKSFIINSFINGRVHGGVNKLIYHLFPESIAELKDINDKLKGVIA